MLKDKDIREPLFDYLEEKYGKSRIFEEKTMGRSRADVIMILPEAVVGIEIKSDADTYARLESQVRDYDRYFDYNIVVVGSSHAVHVGEHVPEYWGIISVESEEEDVNFYVVREPLPNPKMTIEEKMEILWRPELARIQERHGLYAYKGKSKAFVRDYLIGSLERDELVREISFELFERDYTAIAAQINAFREAQGQKPRRKRRYRRRKKK